MNNYENKSKNELMIVSTPTEEQTEYSLAAAFILDDAIQKFTLRRLSHLIDEALTAGNKEAFLVLSHQYKMLKNDQN